MTTYYVTVNLYIEADNEDEARQATAEMYVAGASDAEESCGVEMTWNSVEVEEI